MRNCYSFPQSDLFLTMPIDLTISTIAKELDILKLKLQYASQNPEFIDDRQELSYYLNTLVRARSATFTTRDGDFRYRTPRIKYLRFD
jgi:hypothetical protein